MVKHFNAGSGVFKAVDGVDVDVEPSTIVALLGKTRTVYGDFMRWCGQFCRWADENAEPL
jgi:hypothetical protein